MLPSCSCQQQKTCVSSAGCVSWKWNEMLLLVVWEHACLCACTLGHIWCQHFCWHQRVHFRNKCSSMKLTSKETIEFLNIAPSGANVFALEAKMEPMRKCKDSICTALSNWILSMTTSLTSCCDRRRGAGSLLPDLAEFGEGEGPQMFLGAACAPCFLLHHLQMEADS